MVRLASVCRRLFGAPFPAKRRFHFMESENAFPQRRFRQRRPKRWISRSSARAPQVFSIPYFLRIAIPVLFELHDRFGGVSKGEVWHGQH
jgi:hypothetical protein